MPIARMFDKAENAYIVEYYRALIEPILPLAKQAFGPRSRNTPAHEASAEYTRLLCEFYMIEGSLLQLSRALNVNYSGMRRRVVMSKTFIEKYRPEVPAPISEIPDAVERIKAAKLSGGSDAYYKQILEEYRSGFSMQYLAKGLGLKSATTLYYGAQLAIQKEESLNG